MSAWKTLVVPQHMRGSSAAKPFVHGGIDALGPRVSTTTAPRPRLSRRSFVHLSAGALVGLAASTLHLGSPAAANADWASPVRYLPQTYVCISDFGMYPLAGTTDVYEADYDDAGRIVSIAWTRVETAGGDTPMQSIRCDYGYDARGLLTTIERTARGTYDPPDRNATIQLTYDERGMLLSELDDLGCGYSMEYDEHGGLVGVDVIRDDGGTYAIDYLPLGYSSDGKTLQVGGWTVGFSQQGGVSSALLEDGFSSKALEYDASGRLARIDYSSGLGEYSSDFAYREDGRLMGGTRTVAYGGNGMHYDYPDADLSGIVYNANDQALYWMLSNAETGVAITHEIEYGDAVNHYDPLSGAWNWLDLADPFDPQVVWSPGEAFVRPNLPSML